MNNNEFILTEYKNDFNEGFEISNEIIIEYFEELLFKMIEANYNLEDISNITNLLF